MVLLILCFMLVELCLIRFLFFKSKVLSAADAEEYSL